jgi:hypothetical protein
MTLRRSSKLTATIVVTALVLLWSYGCSCGMLDAMIQGGRMPARFYQAAELYRGPEIAMMNSWPVFGDLIKLGDYFGYDMADGPETTR